MNCILFFQFSLSFIGLSVLSPNIGYGQDISSAEAVKKFLSSWGERLKEIFTEKPVHFFSTADFSRGELRQDVVEEAVRRGGVGPCTGQHLSMPLPRGAMRPLAFEHAKE